jgi:hypothetical protein
MRCLASRGWTLVVGLVAAMASPGMAQEAGATAKLHPWGRFDPGTWKVVRVVTETLNERGQVVSTGTTDTKTTLTDSDNDGVTLDVEACMEVAGKRFQAEPQTVKQGFHGEAATGGLKPKEKDPVDGQVAIEDRKIPCKIQRWELVGGQGKTTIVLHYSATVAPYVLKRECVVTDAEGKTTSETTVEIIALDMPVNVQDEVRSGAYVRTVSKGAKGTTTTLAVVLPDVPGGVVSHSSKEVDRNGRLVRRSTLVLVNYNSDPDKDRTGLFGRKRPPRRTKQPPRHVP